MGEKSIMEVLNENDDPINLEHPKDFNYNDYNEMIKRFEGFVKELQIKIGIPCKYEAGNQDASFHSEIILPQSILTAPKEKRNSKSVTIIRFSNFGNMVSIWKEENIKGDKLKAILGLFKKFGYVYIPYRYLEKKYNGKSRVGGINTWWIRFFDWL